MDLAKASKALSNPTRVRLLEYLLEKRIMNKGDLMSELGLERAALDHHLKPLINAGLVQTIDVIIDRVRNCLCFPLFSVTITSKQELSPEVVRDVIGDEIESDINHDEIQAKAQREVTAGNLHQEDAVAIVRTLFEHRGRGTKNMCSVCGRIKRMIDLSLCNQCFRPVCSTCGRRIKKDKDMMELLCDRCVSQLFG
ncbi:MAG: ArsR family transcriptional regulator [Candidatus Thorarchaeota archaeon]|nr:ArsR family transcriptional regulator [Candidatus Thorarchaeota archaeon]